MEQESIPNAYRDRTGGLIAFGILELLLGLACLVFVALVLMAGQIRVPNAPSPQPSLIPATLVYLIGAIVFNWLGVGSILARRWARTLSLIAGWFWLLTGVAGAAFLLVFMPRMIAALPAAQAPPGAKTAVMGCFTAGWGVFLILLPLGFVLFYGSRNVRATCEARDPQPRWTDRCPAPVLALALMAAFSAVFFVIYSFHPAFPVFGSLWTGAPGAVLFLLYAVVEAALAWGLYRLRPWAWWVRLGLGLLSGASTAYTFHHGVDWGQVLRASGQPENPAMLQMFQSMFTGPYFLASLVAVGIAYLGYLLWVRKYFVARPAEL